MISVNVSVAYADGAAQRNPSAHHTHVQGLDDQAILRLRTYKGLKTSASPVPVACRARLGWPVSLGSTCVSTGAGGFHGWPNYSSLCPPLLHSGKSFFLFTPLPLPLSFHGANVWSQISPSRHLCHEHTASCIFRGNSRLCFYGAICYATMFSSFVYCSVLFSPLHSSAFFPCGCTAAPGGRPLQAVLNATCSVLFPG